jgi:putative DNA primase/helicase
MTDLFDTVQTLCDLGYSVVPSIGKHPSVKWKPYQDRLPTDAEHKSWRYNLKPKPELYGIVTGELSGVVIVDCDNTQAVRMMGSLRPHVRTPRGGGHYYFKHPGHFVKTVAGLLPKIDIRGDGGFVNVIGTTQNGEYQIEIMPTSQGIYQWDQMPKAILEKMDGGEQAAEAAKEAKPGKLIPEGERNDWLFRRSSGYRRNGDSEEVISQKVKIDYDQRCTHDPPMSDKELRAICHSSAKYAPVVDVHRSDTGNATMLVNIYGDTLRYDHKRKRWLRWGKHRWETNYDGHISRLAQEIARIRYSRAVAINDLKEREIEAKWAIASEHRAKVDACVALAKIMEPIADDGINWDRDITLLGAPNGVVDLRAGDLRPGKAEDRITMSTGVDFNPSAECPRWEQFLMEIFDDAELIDWLWRVLGYSIIGETIEQIFMVGCGEGSNGKSRFLEAICNALGDYAYYAPFATFSLPAPSATNDLAALEHRRFVTSSETNIGTRLNIERIKAISGGDKMTARLLYQEFDTYQPHLKLWLFVNHLPDVNDDTIATWRRVRLIPFSKTFIKEAEDKRLGDKLKAEAEGVLAWLVRGCLEWQNRGLTPVPECVRAATGEYRRETDTLISFITDRCVKGEGEEIRARGLYSAYKTWAGGAVDKNKMLTETAFGRQMGKRFEKRVDRRGIHYLGIALADRGIYVDMSDDD